jgi:hypothetical protein
VSEIATVKSGIAMMVSSFKEIWHYFSLVGIGRSLNLESQEEFGRNRIKKMECAYLIFVADMLFKEHFFIVCVLVAID